MDLRNGGNGASVALILQVTPCLYDASSKRLDGIRVDRQHEVI